MHYSILDLHDKYNHLLKWAGLLSVLTYYEKIEEIKKLHTALSELLLHLEEYNHITTSDHAYDLQVMINNIRIIRNHVQDHYEQLIEV